MSLKLFFEQFGSVVEVVFAKKYEGRLFEFKKLAGINLKYKHKQWKIENKPKKSKGGKKHRSYNKYAKKKT